jgi:hypothetical protein
MLARTREEEYYRIFKSAHDGDLRRILQGAFKLRQIANPSPEMLRIMERATAALKMLGQENRINALRVARYGVKISAETE